MKLKPFKRAPVLIAFSVIVLMGLVRWLELGCGEHLEGLTYDWRVRLAAQSAPAVATNLGFVCIDEASVRRVWDGSLGYRFGLQWPRQVYGRLVHELSAQGARAMAFDLVFGELRPDHPQVQCQDGSFVESDAFFAQQMRAAGNVILASNPDLQPPDLFAQSARALGDIVADKDPDGVLRRVQAFRLYRRWHAAFRQLAADPEFGVDLAQARVGPREIVLPRAAELGDIRVPLDPQGHFDLAGFGGTNLPAGVNRFAQPFSEQRVWNLGIVLAAQALSLDLEHAEVDLPAGRILLRGPNGLQRVLPVDAQGRLYLDWALPPNHPALLVEPIERLLAQDHLRLQGQAKATPSPWMGRLVVVGSGALVGNNLTDRGSTPLGSESLLVSKHWNLANAVLTGHFVRRAPLGVELALIGLLGGLAMVVTRQLRVVAATRTVGLSAMLYLAFAVWLYIRTRYWLPVVFPISTLLLLHIGLLVWMVVFEQAERRRVRAVLATIVSPKIANVLLAAEKLELGGSRREITVCFADVRGFTELTDRSQDWAAERVRRQGLSGPEAEACLDAQARETLATVNCYLGLVADTILQHDGTLDKFIGDCVMAFWGAPNAHPTHALACVRAAMAAQRAIYDLNRQRAQENRQRRAENRARQAAGLEPRPLLPILFLGTGINTGMATVGMMGSEVKAVVRQANYTVFGREVNLASRLERLSGAGRIFISQATFEQLRRQDPALAAGCLALPPVTVKGIRSAVQVYEVLWREAGAPPLEQEFAEAPDQSLTTASP